MLLPDRLRAIWEDVDSGRCTRQQATDEQERLLGEYRGHGPVRCYMAM